MKYVLKYRWLFLVLWVIAVLVMNVVKPDMDTLIRDKGQAKIPDSYSSIRAKALLKQLEETPSDVKKMDVAIVFHEDHQLTDQEQNDIEAVVAQLKGKAGTLGLLTVNDPFQKPELKDTLVSSDGKTIMLAASLDKKNRSVQEIRDELHSVLKQGRVSSYLTGSELLTEDQIQTSQKGVKKTETFTAIFIIMILIVIFRSPVAPVLSLFMVGITYIVSLNIVAVLVDHMDFPFAATTQTFLILVLFGIGTDYQILLLSRFKEELGERGVVQAIERTYQTAGRTVLFSGFAVMVGFAVLGLAEFSIYQSAVAIAIGVVVLLASLFTIMPIVMYLLGNRIFWLSRQASEHGSTHFWTFLGRISVAKPWRALILIAMLTLPLLFFNPIKLSFNSMEEADASAESVTGFHILAESFTPGKALPTTVVVSTDQKMDSSTRLAWIDELTRAVAALPGVENVSGPTRPKGKKLKELYVNEQLLQIGQGLSKPIQGIGQIPQGKGLEEITKGLTSAQTAIDQIGQQGSTDWFYAPETALSQESFLRALNTYMSKDRTQFKMSVVLSVDPYSGEAMNIIDDIHQSVQHELKTAGFEHAEYGISGVSSVNRDLSQIADHDFARTAMLMLMGITLMLFFTMRSFWLPVFMMGALLLAYYASMTIVEMTIPSVLGLSGLNWNVPFFSLIMVVSLGVDYSIFYMMRYKEYRHLPSKEAVLQTLKHVGGVILSAAVILAGTFAAMIPSGVSSLIEIATVLILALFLLAVILLPIMIPALQMLERRFQEENSNRQED
ncbi:MMPL family transporter [Paenibacillus sp. N3.4]|uniref:MMPL family transporter n=1 Tax=Paenibacillus sp. N3.4 TaxID=2603222 RepID=UPI0016505385|nr:MMPL family transporter [Paenibacillus sp. N3.4]